MRDIAERFLRAEHKETLWQDDQTAVELLEYVYSGGVWDRQHKERIMQIRDKPFDTLALQEVYTYLTAIIGGERINEGLYDRMIQNGTIAKLLERYLALTEAEQ